MGARPIELPVLGAPVADTHAHLDMLDDPAGVLERAAMAGVSFVLTVADLTEAPEGTFDALDAWLSQAAGRLFDWDIDAVPPDVRILLGVHPHNAKDFDADTEAHLLELVSDPRVAAIGEMGLDFHYDHSPRDAQRRAFRIQLQAAHRCSLPAVVHLRDAHDEGLAILKELGVPDAGCVIHCFTGDAALAEPFIEMGCYISFAGPATFKKADAIRAAAAVPLDRILVETDCPFMAPEPYRGRTNEPAWVVLIAARIAAARGMDPASFAEAVYENSLRVFTRER